MQYDNGKDNTARLASLIPAFRLAIYDQLKLMVGLPTVGEDGKQVDPVYIPSTASLRSAAFKAIEEIVDAESEDLPPRLLLNVWNAVMLTNESAFHQTMGRAITDKTLTGITIAKGAKAVAGNYY